MKTFQLISTAIFCLALNTVPLQAQDSAIGPDYTNAPETRVKPDVPHGKVYRFVMESADSKFYPGLNGPYHRDVYVYVPKQYVSGTAAPFIVAQDGKGYTNRLPVVLDNLIAEHRVPAMVAVMINNGGGTGREANGVWNMIQCRANMRSLWKRKCCLSWRNCVK